MPGRLLYNCIDVSGRLLYNCIKISGRLRLTVSGRLRLTISGRWRLTVSGRLRFSTSCLGAGPHREEGDSSTNQQHGGSLFPVNFLDCLC